MLYCGAVYFAIQCSSNFSGNFQVESINVSLSVSSPMEATEQYFYALQFIVLS